MVAIGPVSCQGSLHGSLSGIIFLNNMEYVLS